MIVYFSATGNSKYVSQRIAKAIGDTALSIETRKPAIDFKKRDILGMVFPIYFWQAASPMRCWLENLVPKGTPSYTFAVATFGKMTGCAEEQTRRILKKCGIELNASFSIRMPDTWTPVFDLSDPETVTKQNEQAESRIDTVIACIKNKESNAHMTSRVPYLAYPFTERIEKIETRTKNFHVKDSCIGCGLCAKRCPMQAIEMKNKKPVWIKEQCYACLRCLHHCPKFAIQYGRHTTKHGQYRNPNVKV